MGATGSHGMAARGSDSHIISPQPRRDVGMMMRRIIVIVTPHMMMQSSPPPPGREAAAPVLGGASEGRSESRHCRGTEQATSREQARSVEEETR